MRANRRKDTKPELALRRALHGQGYRYRKDYRLDLAGGTRVRPDIAFTARKVAVFVDGCFWHGCPQHGSRPAVNVWYWEPKLRRNTERDRLADAALAAAGWAVVRVWEHEPLEAAVASVVDAVSRAPGRPRARNGPRADGPSAELPMPAEQGPRVGATPPPVSPGGAVILDGTHLSGRSAISPCARISGRAPPGLAHS
jgi:DNA mismatch endonuclease, patch repair protein